MKQYTLKIREKKKCWTCKNAIFEPPYIFCLMDEECKYERKKAGE
jgi:hypothetical protein